VSPEIHLLLFDFIDSPVTSACLGLTCKAFYPIHREKHGVVPLDKATCYDLSGDIKFINLALLIKNWVPSHLAYDFKDKKFIRSMTLFERFIQWQNLEAFSKNELAEKNKALREQSLLCLQLGIARSARTQKLFGSEGGNREAWEPACKR
jgi:hypothetical protein